MTIFYGIMIPLLGTALGAACVFFMKTALGTQVQRALCGFAAGVMVAASIWSLLIPAMEQSAELGGGRVLPAVTGFWLGILCLLMLDRAIPHLHQTGQQTEGIPAGISRTAMMLLAVTLHNLPEGMAVGVVYAGVLAGTGQINTAGALALSLGIAIQNFPEGAIIAMSLRAEGMKKSRAFAGGVLSGIVEPLGAALTLLAARLVVPALFSQFRGGSYALCSGGGADPGDVAGTAFQHRHGIFCRWVQRDDDAGCGVGVKESPLFCGKTGLMGQKRPRSTEPVLLDAF